ncbi:transposase, partial [Longicatena sp. 210702-DFI.1.36]
LLLDFKSHQLIDMLPERKKYSLLNYFERIPIGERSNVQYFIMDMYQPYRDVVHFRFPKAKIAVDSFHVVKNINDSLNAVRVRIMKGYKSNTVEYYLLKNFNWLLLEKEVREGKRRFNKRLNQYINYPQLLDRILAISPELKEAYQ